MGTPLRFAETMHDFISYLEYVFRRNVVLKLYKYPISAWRLKRA